MLHDSAHFYSLWGLVMIILGLTQACSAVAGMGMNQASSPALRVTVASPTPFQPQADRYDYLLQSEAPVTLPSATLESSEPIMEGGTYPTPISTLLPVSTLAPYIYPVNLNPLTGLPAFDPSLLERRPMAVKITNYPRYVRPQSGLTRADVVFEYYIEGGLTRFIAVFYGQDAERAGPVRSGRYFDVHVVHMYHAYYVFKYADPREYDFFKNSDLVDFLVVPGEGACPSYSIGKNQVDTYNNIFFNTAKFQDCLAESGADNSRPDFRNGYFTSMPYKSHLPAKRIYTRYSADDYNYWRYDPTSQKYMRYQETDDTRSGKPESYTPLTDALTGGQVSTDNVVVLFVSHTFTNQFDEQDEVYQIEPVDSGQAFLFREGMAFQGMWHRTNVDQPLLLTNTLGGQLPLRPGTTFYQVIGMTSTYQQNGDEWNFTFNTP
jgi:hypothetical protein